MPKTRVYLPATVDLLARWHAAGTIPSTADGFVAPDESEDGEYAALMSAADASAELLASPGKRVVIVVETASPEVDAGGPVSMREVVAVHADLESRAAGADPDEDLGWFATQEIPQLL